VAPPPETGRQPRRNPPLLLLRRAIQVREERVFCYSVFRERKSMKNEPKKNQQKPLYISVTGSVLSWTDPGEPNWFFPVAHLFSFLSIFLYSFILCTPSTACYTSLLLWKIFFFYMSILTTFMHFIQFSISCYICHII